MAPVLAGLLEAPVSFADIPPGDRLWRWHDADVGCERRGVPEARGVAHSGDDAGGRLRANALDGHQQLAHLVGIEQAVDVVLDLGQALTPKVEILADVARLQPVGWAVILADAAAGGLDQLRGQLAAYQVTAVVAQLGQASRGDLREVMCGGASGEEAGCQHAIQAADVAGELGEAQVHQAVELAHAVIEVLIASVLVRSSALSWKRRVLSGLSNATWWPAAASTA